MKQMKIWFCFYILIVIFSELNFLKIKIESSISNKHNLRTKSKFNHKHKQDFVEIIPDEISYPEEENNYEKYHEIISKSNKIPNRAKFLNELYDKSNNYREDSRAKFYHEHPKVYYRDRKSYYGPKKTFENIPKIDYKYKTNIILKNLDHEIFIKSQKKYRLEQYLAELEQEAYKLILFIEEPKFYSKNFPYKVNDRDPYAYRDPTKLDKVLRLRELKEKINSVKGQLGIPISENLEFFVKIKNSTYPKHSDDLLNHYTESFTNFIPHYKEEKNLLINANLTIVDDVYKIRKAHILKKNSVTNGNFHEKSKSTVYNSIEKIKKDSNEIKLFNPLQYKKKNNLFNYRESPYKGNINRKNLNSIDSHNNSKKDKLFLEDFSLIMDNEILEFIQKKKINKKKITVEDNFKKNKFERENNKDLILSNLDEKTKHKIIKNQQSKFANSKI